jgi:prevent-host-death family protein
VDPAMSTSSIAEAKERPPSLIDEAIEGRPVVITRDGKPVAELRPTRKQDSAAAKAAWEWLRALRDAGLVMPIIASSCYVRFTRTRNRKGSILVTINFEELRDQGRWVPAVSIKGRLRGRSSLPTCISNVRSARKDIETLSCGWYTVGCDHRRTGNFIG